MREARLLPASARSVRWTRPGRFTGQRTGRWTIGARCVAVAALAVAVGLATAVSSQAADKVTVTVLVIQASPAKGAIDPQLRDIAEKLKGVVAFESLKLLSRPKQGGPYGQELTFNLPEKMELAVTPLEESDGKIKMRCDLLRPDPEKPGKKKKLLPTLTVTAPKGEGYTIAGPALAEGRLVLVVSAQ